MIQMFEEEREPVSVPFWQYEQMEDQYKRQIQILIDENYEKEIKIEELETELEELRKEKNEIKKYRTNGFRNFKRK